MAKIKDWYKKRTTTELMLIGTAIFLIILIIMRWNTVSKEVSESVSNMFSAPVSTETE
ncbi:MAG: hypothetical protein PHD00_04125 [Bacteroidales bacterium]|nr:hypothetical protein [Bacteroidales bacterium]MDD4673119.1 hypothetical protein [Bacteroidales bacterium]